jgi:hypothetical protein
MGHHTSILLWCFNGDGVLSVTLSALKNTHEDLLKQPVGVAPVQVQSSIESKTKSELDTEMWLDRLIHAGIGQSRKHKFQHPLL